MAPAAPPSPPRRAPRRLSRPTARRSNKSDARRLQPRRLSRMHQAQEEAATRWSASRKCEPPGLRESTGGTCGQRPWQFLAQRQDDTNLGERQFRSRAVHSQLAEYQHVTTRTLHRNRPRRNGKTLNFWGAQALFLWILYGVRPEPAQTRLARLASRTRTITWEARPVETPRLPER